MLSEQITARRFDQDPLVPQSPLAMILKSVIRFRYHIEGFYEVIHYESRCTRILQNMAPSAGSLRWACNTLQA
jgi:hypothetical protein